MVKRVPAHSACWWKTRFPVRRRRVQAVSYSAWRGLYLPGGLVSEIVCDFVCLALEHAHVVTNRA